jgi:hypothetical protein
MYRRRNTRPRTVPGTGSLRLLPVVVAALAVIAGMLVMAD